MEKFRKDYKIPDYSIWSVELTFKIYLGHTQVCDEYHVSSFSAIERWKQVYSLLKIRRRSDADPTAVLYLDGEDISIERITVNDKQLSSRFFFKLLHTLQIRRNSSASAATTLGLMAMFSKSKDLFQRNSMLRSM